MRSPAHCSALHQHRTPHCPGSRMRDKQHTRTRGAQQQRNATVHLRCRLRATDALLYPARTAARLLITHPLRETQPSSTIDYRTVTELVHPLLSTTRSLTAMRSVRLTIVALLSLLLSLSWSATATLQNVNFFTDSACSNPLDITTAVNGTINTSQYWSSIPSSAVFQSDASSGSPICVNQPLPKVPAVASGQYACVSGFDTTAGFVVSEYLTPNCNTTNSTLAPVINATLPFQTFTFNGPISAGANGQTCVFGTVGAIQVLANESISVGFTTAFATFICDASAPNNNSATTISSSAWMWSALLSALVLVCLSTLYE